MHVITVLLRDHGTGQQLVMELGVDVSKTDRLKRRLEETHTYLASLVDTAMDGIVGIDRRGHVKVFNAAARKMFDVKDGQVVNLADLSLMLPKGFLAEVSAPDGHLFLPEAQLMRQNGEAFNGCLQGSRLTREGEFLGFAFSVHDNTRYKALEQEKIEAERMAIVGQTVAGLAHGIKNLIHALDGGIYFLKSGIRNGDVGRIQKGIETLVRNIDRIRVFTHAFLDYARFRSLRPAPCLLTDIVREVVDSFAARASGEGIKLVFDDPVALSPLVLDSERIHEALTNLVGNALDAFDGLESDRAKEVRVGILDQEGAVLIEVADNGIGIDREGQKQLFQRFFTTKGLNGTGLGLLMTRKIIQEHGGHVTVSSQRGKGSVFRIRLPRRRLPKPVHDSSGR